ncbi:MAG: protein-L-isoaspartate O-methyltransferase, partial [Pseudomonadota bacterium]
DGRMRANRQMSDFDAARRAMVDTQVRPADVTRYGIIEAMMWAPRERFVPAAARDIAYAELEVPVAPGRALLEPRVFAKMLEAAQIGLGDLVLDLAPATGYSTVVLARLAVAVVAIEPDEALARQAQSEIEALEVLNAALSFGAAEEGDAAHGPYDVIFVNGAIEALPGTLTEQLKEGGRLVAVFQEGPVGRVKLVTRTSSGLSERWVFDATAPLLDGFARARAFEF